MKILVVSDVHRNFNTLLKIYENENPDVVLCGGDHSKDGEELSFVFPNSQYYIVSGNCDIFDRKYSEELIFNLENIKFFLTHGHNYSVKSWYGEIERRGSELGADIVVFGHTHRQFLSQENSITLFNPGAVINGEYGVIEIKQGNINFFHKRAY